MYALRMSDVNKEATYILTFYFTNFVNKRKKLFIAFVSSCAYQLSLLWT